MIINNYSGELIDDDCRRVLNDDFIKSFADMNLELQIELVLFKFQSTQGVFFQSLTLLPSLNIATMAAKNYCENITAAISTCLEYHHELIQQVIQQVADDEVEQDDNQEEGAPINHASDRKADIKTGQSTEADFKDLIRRIELERQKNPQPSGQTPETPDK